LCCVKIFKLEEENAALLHHLPKLFAETADSGSAVVLGCRLVEATVQPTDSILIIDAKNFKFEDIATYPPLIIFYQGSLQKRLFLDFMFERGCMLVEAFSTG